jgi:hypothetical protein
MKEVGNQYIQSREVNPLEDIFNKFGMRGIKQAQQVQSTPLTKVMGSKKPESREAAFSIVEGEHDWYKHAQSQDPLMRLLASIFGISLDNQVNHQKLQEVQATRLALTPTTGLGKWMVNKND